MSYLSHNEVETVHVYPVLIDSTGLLFYADTIIVKAQCLCGTNKLIHACSNLAFEANNVLFEL